MGGIAERARRNQSGAAPGQDITVLGAGIVGICCALSLREAGLDVLLVDRGDPGQGASAGNAGVVSPWSCVPQSLPGLWRRVPGWLLDPNGPLAIPARRVPSMLPWAFRFIRAGRASRLPAIADAMAALLRSNIGLYRHHLANTGSGDLLQDSFYVQAYRTGATPRRSDPVWQLRARRGADPEWIDGRQLREIEPALSPAYRGALLIRGQARAVSPGRLGATLAEKFRRMGGRIVRADVHALHPGDAGGWTLRTGAADIHTARVVMAAGAWSATLLRPLGLRVPLQAERGYHVTIPDPGVVLAHSVMDVAAKCVASSMADGLRVAGHSEFAAPDAPPDARRTAILERRARAMLPGLSRHTARPWMGVRPSLPDSLPCIGPAPGWPGLVLAFGHSHYGLGMAPVTGRLVTACMTATPPPVPLAPYDIGRF